MVGIQIGRGGTVKPKLIDNTLRNGHLISLDEGAANQLGLRRLMISEDIKFITSMEAHPDGGYTVVDIQTTSGIYRLGCDEKGRYRLEVVNEDKNQDSPFNKETRGLVTEAKAVFGNRKPVNILCLPSLLSQLGRAGCQDTPEAIAIAYQENTGKETVLWVSEATGRGMFYVLPADLDGDGSHELIIAMNGWCDSMGKIRLYGLSGTVGTHGPQHVAIDEIPADAPEIVRQHIENLYSSETNVRLKAVAELGKMGHKATPAVPFLINMLGDPAMMVSDGKFRPPVNLAGKTLASIGAPAVYPLLDALNHKEVGIRKGAEAAFRQMTDPSSAKVLVDALADSDPIVQKNVVRALGWMHSPDATSGLFFALKHENEDVRALAAEAILDPMGRDIPLETLVAALHDDHPHVRSTAAGLLRNVKNPEAIKALTAALVDTDPQVRLNAIDALTHVDEPAVKEGLAGLLDSGNMRVRVEAACALASRSDTRALPVLTEAVTDNDADIRLKAVEGLRRLAKETFAVVDPLTIALRDDNQRTRELAALALGDTKSPFAVAPLIAALRDSAVIRVRYLERALASMVSVAPTSIAELLKDNRVHVRKSAAWAIGDSMSSPRADMYPAVVMPLIEALNDPDLETRKLVVQALGMTMDLRGAEPLIALLKNPAKGVPAEAAEALGRIKDDRSLNSIIDGLENSDATVRKYAAMALGNIQNHRALDFLISALDDPDPQVRAAVAEALRKITREPFDVDIDQWQAWWRGIQNPQSSMNELIKNLDSANDNVRWRAIWTLSELGDSKAIDALFERFVNRKDGLFRGKAVYPKYKTYETDIDLLQASLFKQGEPVIERLITVAGYGWLEKRATEILMRMGDPAVQPLINALNTSSSFEAKTGAAKVLERLKPVSAVIPLLRAANGSSGNHMAAYQALTGYGNEALPDLQKTLADPELNRISKGAAAALMVNLGDRSGWSLLEWIVTDGPTMEMNRIVGRMGKLNNPVFMPLIESAIRRKDAQSDVVYAAVFCGGIDAVPVLQKALNHPNDGVSDGARRWIRKYIGVNQKAFSE